MAEAPGAESAGGQQETRDGPHLRPSFLLSEPPPVAGSDGADAGCQAATPPGSGQQVFRRRPPSTWDTRGVARGRRGSRSPTARVSATDDQKPAATRAAPPLAARPIAPSKRRSLHLTRERSADMVGGAFALGRAGERADRADLRGAHAGKRSWRCR